MKRGAIALLAALAVLVACSTRAPSRTIPGPRAPDTGAGAVIRVALTPAGARIGGTADFTWLHPDGRTPVAHGRPGEQWRVEREQGGPRVRAVRPNGGVTPWSSALLVRVAPPGRLTVGSKRYRGDLVVAPVADSLTIVNRVSLEDYLRGVVALEMGIRQPQDVAAVQAQAVAARSYATIRLANAGRAFDVHASVLDQAYGGLDVENEIANAAVDATRGLVLWYDGRVVDAPYSSTCGGTTAEPQEVWRAAPVPYLRRVSDRIAGSDRHYCDIAPRFRWTRVMPASELNAALARYLASYANVPAEGPGRARRVDVARRMPSGRVDTLAIETDRGRFPLRANDIRFVLRAPGGGILYSTYFSVESGYGRDGFIEQLTLRGQGNGHGIGMCQWGAIGRSRAGQSFRTILGTYYPGTTVGPVQ